ncbi:phosphomannomutase [Pseudoprimorskyibacter insulae]|uniref:Phosphoglucosamine mutase n=1 Tax=Pseudoprimorskyibacter insulae TaxID=1695997 RepID=A0A2R8B0R0_9RHOB|nr:phosphomannomutase [Pseudoprimorskyibacter insulae]SPF81807.1 Phosphoglucosamine mutase [Pseudoprimorskyibacter insulae]
MAPKFGTSGLRGLVTELTPELVQDYTVSFTQTCDTGGVVYVGWDLRPSSPDIARAVIAAVRAQGLTLCVAGVLPTPALAAAAAKAGAGAIMITGSHIPADRNGLKFYTTQGEISKADEANILAHLDSTRAWAEETPLPASDEGALRDYVARYAAAFGGDALTGLTVGVYQHSSVARDVMVEVVEALGGTAVPLGRTDTFTPVDTEAVDEDTRSQFRDWCTANGLDALISTDGDADRPMVTDHTGQVVPGDVLGALTARALGASVICTPISSNTMIEAMPAFTDIRLSRIGSPYVIAAMEEVLAGDAGAAVVGYEANGGFLLGFEAKGPTGALAPLMTRDCLLPILCSLHAAKAAGQPLADVVAALPPRFTAANRLTEVPTEASAKLIAALRDDAAARAAFFETGSEASDINTLDGLRVSFANGDVVHLRPSGNAPELRCYAEASSAERAWDLVNTHLTKLRAMI